MYNSAAAHRIVKQKRARMHLYSTPPVFNPLVPLPLQPAPSTAFTTPQPTRPHPPAADALCSRGEGPAGFSCSAAGPSGSSSANTAAGGRGGSSGRSPRNSCTRRQMKGSLRGSISTRHTSTRKLSCRSDSTAARCNRGLRLPRMNLVAASLQSVLQCAFHPYISALHHSSLPFHSSPTQVPHPHPATVYIHTGARATAAVA